MGRGMGTDITAWGQRVTAWVRKNSCGIQWHVLVCSGWAGWSLREAYGGTARVGGAQVANKFSRQGGGSTRTWIWGWRHVEKGWGESNDTLWADSDVG